MQGAQPSHFSKWDAPPPFATYAFAHDLSINIKAHGYFIHMTMAANRYIL